MCDRALPLFVMAVDNCAFSQIALVTHSTHARTHKHNRSHTTACLHSAPYSVLSRTARWPPCDAVDTEQQLHHGSHTILTANTVFAPLQQHRVPHLLFRPRPVTVGLIIQSRADSSIVTGRH